MKADRFGGAGSYAAVPIRKAPPLAPPCAISIELQGLDLKNTQTPCTGLWLAGLVAKAAESTTGKPWIGSIGCLSSQVQVGLLCFASLGPAV